MNVHFLETLHSIRRLSAGRFMVLYKAFSKGKNILELYSSDRQIKSHQQKKELNKTEQREALVSPYKHSAEASSLGTTKCGFNGGLKRETWYMSCLGELDYQGNGSPYLSSTLSNLAQTQTDLNQDLGVGGGWRGTDSSQMASSWRKQETPTSELAVF